MLGRQPRECHCLDGPGPETAAERHGLALPRRAWERDKPKVTSYLRGSASPRETFPGGQKSLLNCPVRFAILPLTRNCACSLTTRTIDFCAANEPRAQNGCPDFARKR